MSVATEADKQRAHEELGNFLKRRAR
jgi:hypothetical protein